MLAKILRGRYGVAYDRAYRCQVVSNHRQSWSIEDPNLRNEALVGRKKK